jgi:Tfp pilus assembly protein PilF
MFLELAVKLEPEIAEHHYNRALFLENQKAYEAAKEEYKVAIDLDDKNESYYSEYGNLLLALNEFGGAEQQYLEALQLNPANANVWTNLGILYIYNKDVDRAENALKKAISLEPNNTLPYLNLIKLYNGTGKENEAKEIKNLYKSLKLDSLEINIMHLDR